MTTTTTPTPVAVRWRRATVAVLGTAAAALSTAAIPGADALVGGWFLSGAEIIHRVHEVGFGLIMTVCIAVPFLAQAVAPRRAVSFAWAAVASPAATIVALAASGLAADAAPFVILLLVGVAIVVLHPARGAARLMGFDRPLLAVAIAGAVPLVVEAWIQTGLQRAATVDDPHASPPHYAGMAALALCIIALTIVAARRDRGHRMTATLAAAAIVTWAAASLLNLGFVGALSARAAVAAIAAATLYLALVWRPDDAPDPMPTRRWPS